MLLNIINAVSGLLVPIIALMTWLVYQEQCRIEKTDLKYKLFDHRLKIFKSFMSFLADTLQRGKTDFESIGRFWAETSETLFLLPQNILEKRDEIYKNGLDLITVMTQLYPSDGSRGVPEGPERDNLCQKLSDLLSWFYDQIKETEKLFESVMKIDSLD